MSWPNLRLGDAGKWLSGGTPSTSDPRYWGGATPWIGSGALTDFHIHASDRNLTDLGLGAGTRVVGAGTLIMVVRGMSLKQEFRMGIADRTVAFGQDCKALVPDESFEPLFLAYAVRSLTPEVLASVDEAGHGTGRIQTDRLFALTVPRPPRNAQRAIAEVLGALDDKITVNGRLQASSRELRAALMRQASAGRETRAVGSLICLLTRGKAPSYANTDTRIMAINQKCVRDGTVSIAPSRHAEAMREPQLQVGDTLVNSTGQGTLGRVGVWRENVVAFADSHVTILRFDRDQVDPWVGAEAVLAAEALIEAMAEGSTGQTELSRKSLAELEVPVPALEVQHTLGTELRTLHEREQLAVVESRHLSALRDTLLPHLMSGRITVREAEKRVEEAV